MVRVCPGALQKLRQRETGELPPRELPASVSRSRAASLGLSATKLLEPTNQGGGILWLDVDNVEHRYLLSTTVNCTIAIYDVQMPSSREGPAEKHAALAVNHGNPRGRESAAGHKFSVSG
mmetsp:Transcript_20955/g.58126  ORF Transcript_20955/g.58126 Transcript_20955/m.58126 type:complete len:120 (+) Transcript_20955:292-651(+)